MAPPIHKDRKRSHVTGKRRISLAKKEKGANCSPDRYSNDRSKKRSRVKTKNFGHSESQGKSRGNQKLLKASNFQERSCTHTLGEKTGKKFIKKNRGERVLER